MSFSGKQGAERVWCKENTEMQRNTAEMNHFRIRTLNAKHQFEACDIVTMSCNDNVVSIIEPRELAKIMIQWANSSGGIIFINLIITTKNILLLTNAKTTSFTRVILPSFRGSISCFTCHSLFKLFEHYFQIYVTKYRYKSLSRFV